MRSLVAIPVYNEEKQLSAVLRKTLSYPMDVLVIDDGSTDCTPEVLGEFPQVHVLRHASNRGYGAALRDAFQFAIGEGYEVVLTMDSDGQHEPTLIPEFLEAAKSADIVSGSRYLKRFDADSDAPKERRRINALVTDELNACLGLGISDSFCGFKAYRTSSLARLDLTEDGYGMPLELWIEAACKRLRIREIAVPRVYFDANRSFGAVLDDADARLAYYQEVIDRAYARARQRYGCRMHSGRVPKFHKVPNR